MDSPLDAEVLRVVALEDGALAAARQRAPTPGRLPPPEVGSLLQWAAHTAGARHVVEIGSASGVSGLWLLRGMAPRGILTSIEPDPAQHDLATSAYEEAGLGERVRCILGDPLDVLPRLSDGGYDLCLLQTRPAEYPEFLDHARRLLVTGGWLVARQVLPEEGTVATERVVDRTARERADALRRFLVDLSEDERFTCAVVACDGGVALATKDGGGA